MFVIVSLLLSICLEYSLIECQELSQVLHRLPNNVQPHFYDLTLWMPRIWNNFTYEGQVLIDLSIIENTNSIALNIDSLIIHKANTTLLNTQKDRMIIVSQFVDEEKQFFIIQFNDDLQVGNYSLYLMFNGEIRDDIFGFYRSTYNDGDKIKWMTVTQFSPIFARRAFPCFDEPYLKATFKLHIGHYGNQTVTSNTQREKIQLIDDSNYYLTTMKQTPIMSTYLLGWVIHDFNYCHLSNLTSFGMWSRPPMMGKGAVALKEGKLIYSELESWMDVHNPIRKLEHVAVPDFNFHAMENWGMITFRESAVILEPHAIPTKSIHEGLGTMAHEYAHTWFGNLVTPEFWNVAWLKEGFATYFSYFGRSLVYPHFRFMDLFVVENLQQVFQDDAAEHNRTMNGENFGAADDALGFLDFCAYKKGAAIVRMVQYIMGEESFKMALRSYLTNRSYNFATPSILYTHLQNYTKKLGSKGGYIDIGEIIETYANKPGYPLITITRNYNSSLIEISQERFYLNFNSTRTTPSGWWIPLNLVSKLQKQSNISKFGSIWLSPEDKKMTIKVNIDPVDWVICDIDKTGYYRVNYDMNNWNILIMHLDSRGFNGIDQIARATLIDDAFNLARSGYIDYKLPFQLGNYLRHETEYEPWLAAVKSFNFLTEILQDLPVLHNSLQVIQVYRSAKICDYYKQLIEPIYQLLTFHEIDEDQLNVKLLRNLILTTVCELKNADCLKTTIVIFQNWISNSSQGVKPNLKSIVYCEGIKTGNSEQWEEVFDRFLNVDLHIEKELLIKGLGCTTNATLINKFLNFSISNNGPELPKQYQLTIIYNILDGDYENVNYILNFISHNVKKILQFRGHVFLKNIINAIKRKITSTKNLQMLSSFVNNNINHLGSSLKSAEDAIEYAKKTIAWKKVYSPIIAKLFGLNISISSI